MVCIDSGMMRLSVCLGVVGLLAGCRTQEVEGNNVTAGSEEPMDNNLLETAPAISVNKSIQELCSSKHVVTCLKLWLIRGLERLSRRPSLELLPGLTVGGDMSSLQDLPRDVTMGHLDEALLHSLTRYLSSLSLTVRVMDGGVVQRLQQMGETFSHEADDNSTTGRRKRYGSSMMMAGMMSGGTMMALGMSAIAAMAGKALMTALLSLMLSAMSAMKGGGGGGEKTTYEIIHGGHDVKHRSMEGVEADSSVVYPYYLPHPAARRNLLIPLHRR